MRFLCSLVAKPPRVCKTSRMKDKQPTPLQASFWLTNQEKTYMLVLCAVLLVGLIARYFYLKNEKAEVYTPPGIEKPEEE